MAISPFKARTGTQLRPSVSSCTPPLSETLLVMHAGIPTNHAVIYGNTVA